MKYLVNLNNTSTPQFIDASNFKIEGPFIKFYWDNNCNDPEYTVNAAYVLAITKIKEESIMKASKSSTKKKGK